VARICRERDELKAQLEGSRKELRRRDELEVQLREAKLGREQAEREAQALQR
jgi:hypothetical protein